MTDLISRSALMNELEKFKLPEDCMAHEWALQAADDVAKYTIKTIKAAPTVDAVPVVRCRDCKHRGGYNCPMYHTETSLDDLDGFDDYNVDKTDGDGFCHRGERREQNESE